MGYKILTKLPIIVKTSSDSNSVTITWEYVCERSGCRASSVYGNESMVVELPKMDNACSSSTFSSGFTWNGSVITYSVERTPMLYDEPRISPSRLDSVDGSIYLPGNGHVDLRRKRSFDCGEAKYIDVNYGYTQTKYLNKCHKEIIIGCTGTTTLLFDCSENPYGDDGSGFTNILGYDVTYIYKCAKCSGATCVPSVTIDGINVESMTLNGNKIDAIPCSGATNLSCNISYRKVTVDSECNKTVDFITSSTVNGVSVNGCSNSSKCCKAHYVKSSPIVIEGKTFMLDILMDKDYNGSCYSGCGDTCESGITMYIKDDWTLKYLGVTYNKSSIYSLPTIPLSGAVFVFNYNMEFVQTNLDCSTSSTVVNGSGTSIISAETCNNYIYSINMNGSSGTTLDGCSTQNPTFGFVKKLRTRILPTFGEFNIEYTSGGTTYSAELTIPYNREMCY